MGSTASCNNVPGTYSIVYCLLQPEYKYQVLYFRSNSRTWFLRDFHLGHFSPPLSSLSLATYMLGERCSRCVSMVYSSTEKAIARSIFDGFSHLGHFSLPLSLSLSLTPTLFSYDRYVNYSMCVVSVVLLFVSLRRIPSRCGGKMS